MRHNSPCSCCCHWTRRSVVLGHGCLRTKNRSTGQCGFSEALSDVRTGFTLVSRDQSSSNQCDAAQFRAARAMPLPRPINQQYRRLSHFAALSPKLARKAGICRNGKSRIVVRLHTETLAEIRTVRAELFGEIGRTHAQVMTQLERLTNLPSEK